MSMPVAVRPLRIRDRVIPWIYFNLVVAALPVLLKLLIRALKDLSPVSAALYEDPDLLLVSFAICAAAFVDISDARIRGVIQDRPNGIYFLLLCLGGIAFIAYVWYLYDKSMNVGISVFRINAVIYAVYWSVASVLCSIAVKTYSIVREQKA